MHGRVYNGRRRKIHRFRIISTRKSPSGESSTLESGLYIHPQTSTAQIPLHRRNRTKTDNVEPSPFFNSHRARSPRLRRTNDPKDLRRATPDAAVRRQFAQLGEEASLDILRKISTRSVRESLSAYIVFMAKKARAQGTGNLSPSIRSAVIISPTSPVGLPSVQTMPRISFPTMNDEDTDVDEHVFDVTCVDDY